MEIFLPTKKNNYLTYPPIPSYACPNISSKNRIYSARFLPFAFEIDKMRGGETSAKRMASGGGRAFMRFHCCFVVVVSPPPFASPVFVDICSVLLLSTVLVVVVVNFAVVNASVLYRVKNLSLVI